MEKIVGREQLDRVLQRVPQEKQREGLKKLVDAGYKLEGYNYTAPQKDSTFTKKSLADSTGFSDTKVGGFGKSIFDFFTSATQKLGETAGGAIAAPKNLEIYNNSLKSWSDMSNNLAKQIADYKAAGKDTTHLMDMLKIQDSNKPRLDDFVGEKTARQMRESFVQNLEEVAGEGIGTVLEALSGGIFESGVKTLTDKGLSTGQKIAQGAKIGAGYGAASGAAGAMQNESSVGDVAKSTAIGAATGAAVGAGTEAAGAVISKVAPAISEEAGKVFQKAKKEMAKTSEQRTSEAFTNKMWKKIQPSFSTAAEAEQTGRKVTEGRFKTEVLPNDADKEKIKLLESIGAKPTMKGLEIADMAEKRVTGLNKDVKAFILKHDKEVPILEFSQELGKSIKSDQAKRALVFGNSEELERAYQSMVDGFLSLSEGNSIKLSQIFDNRQEFDKLANKYIPKAFNAEARDTVKKVALRDIRDTANTFVVDHIEGGEAIRDVLKEESLLLDTIGDIKENTKIGNTLLGNRTKKAIKVLGGAAVTGGGVGYVTNRLTK